MMLDQEIQRNNKDVPELDDSTEGRQIARKRVAISKSKTTNYGSSNSLSKIETLYYQRYLNRQIVNNELNVNGAR